MDNQTEPLEVEQPELIRQPMPGRAANGHGKPKAFEKGTGRPKGVPLRISTTQLVVALIAANGDRKLVADQLGVKRSRITQRINMNPQLKARFACKANVLRNQVDMAKLEREGKTPLDGIGVMERQMEELAVGQGRIANIALSRLEVIQTRLKLGREARLLSAMGLEHLTEDQKRFIKENELDYDKDGIPVEEKLLMDQEVAMMREYTRTNEAVSQIAYKKVVTEQLMRKIGGARSQRPKPSLASAPKTNVNISGSQVVIQTPAEKPNGN